MGKDLRTPEDENQFTESNIEYPNDYRIKPLHEQLDYLWQLAPGLGLANPLWMKRPLPKGAEGFFAIPRWEFFAPTYQEAVGKIFAFFPGTRLFYNYRQKMMTVEYFRYQDRSEQMFRRLEDEQKGSDILIVPAQFGRLYRGYSAKKARKAFGENEFGVGAFMGAIMLLTHPSRMRRYGDLSLLLPGDDIFPFINIKPDLRFREVPAFLFRTGALEFSGIQLYSHSRINSHASAFLFQ